MGDIGRAQVRLDVLPEPELGVTARPAPRSIEWSPTAPAARVRPVTPPTPPRPRRRPDPALTSAVRRAHAHRRARPANRWSARSGGCAPSASTPRDAAAAVHRGAWYDGINTAGCTPPTGRHDRGPHPVPSDDCECGFYAYGSVESARQNKHMRYVQAVVSCWGRWSPARRAYAPNTPASSPSGSTLTRRTGWPRVAARYPSARLFADADPMVAEYPLTELTCYQLPRPRRLRGAVLGAGGRRGAGARSAAARAAAPRRPLWAAVVGRHRCRRGCSAAGCCRLARHRARGAAWVVAGVLAWLLAPLFGLPGWAAAGALAARAGRGRRRYLLAAVAPALPGRPNTPAPPPFAGVRA